MQLAAVPLDPGYRFDAIVFVILASWCGYVARSVTFVVIVRHVSRSAISLGPWRKCTIIFLIHWRWRRHEQNQKSVFLDWAQCTLRDSGMSSNRGCHAIVFREGRLLICAVTLMATIPALNCDRSTHLHLYGSNVITGRLLWNGCQLIAHALQQDY